MKCIYVAGKLNGMAVDYIKNMSAMMKMALHIQKLGFSVFVPCLDMLMGIIAGDFDYTDYADNNMAWLERADAVFVLPDSEDSKGTQAEIRRAQELDIPVYHSIDDLVISHCEVA